jgi:hypothetical protein
LIFVVVMALLFPLAAIGILYPDDPENRRARTVRAVATICALSVALGSMEAILTALSFGAGDAPASLAIMILAVLLSAVPVSAAERIAGLFRPRRTLSWALGGVAGCLVWAWLVYSLLERDTPRLPQWAVIVEFTLPGIAAGLTWYAFLPKRGTDVGQIFK